MIMITSDDSPVARGQFVAATRAVTSVRCRGQDIGDAKFVGTTFTGRDWFAYTDDLDECPDLLHEYYTIFDTNQKFK